MSDLKEDWQPHISTTNVGDIWYTGNTTLIGVHELIKTINSVIYDPNLSVKAGVDKITLFIHSNGGSVSAALLLHDFLNLNSQYINVVAATRICSAACLLLFTKCPTYALPSTHVVFHPMNFEYSDSQQAVEKRAGYHKHLIKQINAIYLTKGFKCKWETEDVYLYLQQLFDKKIILGVYDNFHV